MTRAFAAVRRLIPPVLDLYSAASERRPGRSSAMSHPSSRTCIIYNPTARGGKAALLRRRLESAGVDSAFLPTDGVGAATRLTAEAIANGFETIVAAGGDGTLNEVLNGFALADDGFTKARLAHLPFGTVNVFAKELNLPLAAEAAWRIIAAGNERRIDVGEAAFEQNGERRSRLFIQLGGAGLDARAIELVDWEQKKRWLQIAYLIAGMKALRERQPELQCAANGTTANGSLILFGNGRYYGGRMAMFPRASMDDGRLDACVFKQFNLWTAARCSLHFLSRRRGTPPGARHLASSRLRITSEHNAAFELEGDFVGHVPLDLCVRSEPLRVVCPARTG